jgi:hypothetical protein
LGTKEVPARLEWNRDFFCRNDGAVHIRIVSSRPFSVTGINDNARQALVKGEKFERSDVFLTEDAKPPQFDRRLALPKGHDWLIIENQPDSTAKMTLQCYDVQ